MTGCKKQILNALLDKYEKSKSYKEGVSYSRRVMLKLYDHGKSDFREYSIENADIKDDYNYAVKELKAVGVIDFEWMKYESGNIIACVWLVLERLADAYVQAERQPKFDRVEEMLSYIAEIAQSISHDWVKNYFYTIYSNIEKKRSITIALPEDANIARDVLRAMQVIDNIQGDENLERVFSVRCFGDSKRFERTVRSRIVSIVRKYYVDDPDEKMSDEEALRQIGIIKAPETVEFCGNITVKFDNGEIDYSVLRYGATINSFDIRNCSIKLGSGVSKVLFIENKANYVDYILNRRQENEFVIFHGGFYSQVKGMFFQKIYSAATTGSVSFYHWGDIDFGGFSIFRRLKMNLIPSLRPYNMGINELQSYKDYLIPVESRYVDKLKQLLYDPILADCQKALEYLIYNKVKLEQEVFIIDG